MNIGDFLFFQCWYVGFSYYTILYAQWKMFCFLHLKYTSLHPKVQSISCVPYSTQSIIVEDLVISLCWYIHIWITLGMLFIPCHFLISIHTNLDNTFYGYYSMSFYNVNLYKFRWHVLWTLFILSFHCVVFHHMHWPFLQFVRMKQTTLTIPSNVDRHSEFDTSALQYY